MNFNRKNIIVRNFNISIWIRKYQHEKEYRNLHTFDIIGHLGSKFQFYNVERTRSNYLQNVRTSSVLWLALE